MSSTICNMFSKIKNSSMVGKDFVEVKRSKYVLAILSVLKNDGYIEGYEALDRTVRVTLKYYNGQSVIRSIKAVSTPRRPIYRTARQIQSMIRNNFGTFVVSTNKGVCAHQEALLHGDGGQIICLVRA